MRRFYISPEEFQKERPEITGADAHHICSVLRLMPGTKVGLFDGENTARRAIITEISEKSVKFQLLSEELASTESFLRLTIAQALLKGQKLDDLIRPLTELGVTKIIPFIAQRSVAVPGEDRYPKRLARWEKIAIEALKQCGRQKASEIHPPTSFEKILQLSEKTDLKIIFWEEETL